MTDRTSRRVARIAARVLRVRALSEAVGVVVVGHVPEWFKWSDIRALAASCLTQHEPEYDGGRTPKKRKNGVVRKARPKMRNPKGLKRGRKNPWDDPKSRAAIMHGIKLASRNRKRALHLSG